MTAYDYSEMLGNLLNSDGLLCNFDHLELLYMYIRQSLLLRIFDHIKSAVYRLIFIEPHSFRNFITNLVASLYLIDEWSGSFIFFLLSIQLIEAVYNTI